MPWKVVMKSHWRERGWEYQNHALEVTWKARILLIHTGGSPGAQQGDKLQPFWGFLVNMHRFSPQKVWQFWKGSGRGRSLYTHITYKQGSWEFMLRKDAPPPLAHLRHLVHSSWLPLVHLLARQKRKKKSRLSTLRIYRWNSHTQLFLPCSRETGRREDRKNICNSVNPVFALDKQRGLVLNNPLIHIHDLSSFHNHWMWAPRPQCKPLCSRVY